MVDRKIYLKRHLLAFFVTAMIFTVGLLIGINITDKRVKEIQELNEDQKADFESLQLQYLYLTSQNKSCVVFEKTLEQNVYDLENARIKVENYIQASENEGLSRLKRSYVLTELRYWLLAQQTKETCGSDKISILYFYRLDTECPSCSTQGYILTYLKEIFKEKLLIFSIDIDTNEQMVEILKNVYGIKEAPTLIIDNRKVEGLSTKEELIEILCSSYGNVDECKSK